jgi:hypothetical protein
MTVKELRERLEGYADEDEVMFAYNFGDRGDTQVAEGVRSVEYDVVEKSSYHRMWAIQGDTPRDLEDEDDSKEVVVLS